MGLLGSAPNCVQTLKRLAELMPANCIMFSGLKGNEDIANDARKFSTALAALLNEKEASLRRQLSNCVRNARAVGT